MTSQVNDSAICHNCLNLIDAATSIDNKNKPQEGDLSICAYCGTIHRYDTNLMTKPVLEIELWDLHKEDFETWFQVVKVRSLIMSNPMPSPKKR